MWNNLLNIGYYIEMTDVKRPYRSERRQEQAEETRDRILQAARRLFVDGGYGGTTIEAIAERAGVAAPTVYASLGSKRGILMALLDRMAADADLPRMQAAVRAAVGDPRKQLRETVAFTVRFYTGGADLIDIARTVSGVEPDLREMWREGEGRRYRAVTDLARSWREAGALAPGLSAEEAGDIVWALSGPDVFRLFVLRRGWSVERFENWIGTTLEGLLFG